MKRAMSTLVILLNFSLVCLSQESHLSLIYDFEGEDFNYATKGMVGINDSLYIIGATPNGQGVFYRLDSDGGGYNIIWQFDAVNYAPSSLIANDTIIYGTTRFSSTGGGTLFKYSLQDYTFEFIKEFDPFEVQETSVKYITDSVLWLSSQTSFTDEGSIFIMDKDGTNLKKVYNDTNMEKGQNPTDFIFYEDSIYIACFNGGGVPYPDGTGSTVASGSIIRIHADGTGYQNIIQGGDDKGTQPNSLLIRENKLIGLFVYSGSSPMTGGQFFRSELDGSSYDSLGALSSRAYTKMISTDSLIYGISAYSIFGISPFDGEIRIFEDLQSNPDYGYDVVSNPAFLNGYIYLATQQGGPNGGGTILKWTNIEPDCNEQSNGRTNGAPTEINLNTLFTDPEGDILSFDYEYNSNEIDLIESNGILTITPLVPSESSLKIIANDGWVGFNSITYTYVETPIQDVINSLPEKNIDKLSVYPNPTNSKLYLGSNKFEMIEILTLKGELIKSYHNPKGEINISSLENGTYIIRCLLSEGIYSQKIIKQ